MLVPSGCLTRQPCDVSVIFSHLSMRKLSFSEQINTFSLRPFNRISVLCSTHSSPTKPRATVAATLLRCRGYFYFVSNHFRKGHLLKLWLMRHKQKSPGERGLWKNFSSLLRKGHKKRWAFFFLQTPRWNDWKSSSQPCYELMGGLNSRKQEQRDRPHGSPNSGPALPLDLR